jgi:hypothetical protein
MNNITRLFNISRHNQHFVNFIFIRAVSGMYTVPNHVCERFYAVMLACGNSQAGRGFDDRSDPIHKQFNRPAGQDGQVVMLVGVLHQNVPRWYASFFGVHARAEMVMNHIKQMTHKNRQLKVCTQNHWQN